MGETDLQLGGGYTYQWECAILLALNYLYEPVRYNPTLDDLVTGFLGQVGEIHLEGKDRETGIELEDICLVRGSRRILIQVKTKQADYERWTPTDPLLLKSLCHFCDSGLSSTQPDNTRFVFLTNRPFNRNLAQIQAAISRNAVDRCPEADQLLTHLEGYARREKGTAIDPARFQEMLTRTALVEFLGVDEVKANVQAKLQAHGRADWQQAHAVLFEHFARQSTLIGGGVVTRESVGKALGPGSRVETDAQVEARYRQQVARAYGHLTLRGYPERDPRLSAVRLERIFIKLSTTTSRAPALDMLPSGRMGELEKLRERQLRGRGRRAEGEGLVFEGKPVTEAEADELVRRYEQEMEERRRPQTITLSVPEALRDHSRLVITGPPGSGKTTLLRWLALTFAEGKQALADRLGQDYPHERLPVVVELRSFQGRFAGERERLATVNLADEIAAFVAEDARFEGTPAGFIRQALANGDCLVTFDGLDEIAEFGARQRASAALQAFADNYSARGNHVVVTSRPAGYRGVELGAGFQQCEINPFTPEDISQFIHHWYEAAYFSDPATAREDADRLVQAVQRSDRVTKLAETPLLCTIIAIVYRNNRILPNRRVDLYLKCCEALLDTWERVKEIRQSGLIGGFDWQTKLELLSPLAYWLHSEKGRTAAPEKELEVRLAAELRQRRLCEEPKAEQEARAFLAAIRERSGLLQGRGDGTLEFPHLTFQEYLAARHIAAQPDPDYIDLVMPHLHEMWWREVHLLAIGHLGSGRDGAPKAGRLLEEILDRYKPPVRLLRAIPYPGSELTQPLSYHPSEPDQPDSGRLKTLPGRAFPRWQEVRRLAWALQRERFFAAAALGDCAPLGVTNEVRDRIQATLEEVFLLAMADVRWTGPDTPWLATAARSLGELGQAAPEVVAILVSALGDSAWAVRVAAARSLGELGQTTPEVVTALVGALRDNEGRVRAAAARSLGQLGQATPEVVAALVDALGDYDSDIQAAVVSCLRQLGRATPEVVEALIGALKGSYGFPREGVVRSLSQLGQATPQVVASLVSALRGSDRFVREGVVRSLGQLGQATPEVVAALVGALRGSDGFVREAAASSLGQLRQATPGVVAALVGTLRDNEGRVREAAARSLGQLGQATPEMVVALVDAVGDSDRHVRKAAMRSLGQLGQVTPAVVAAMVGALGDSDRYVQVAAASSLGQLGQATPEVATVVVGALRRSDGFLREEAARSLGELGQTTPEVVTALVGALRDNEGRVRAAAARSLGQLGQATPEVVAALVDALGDYDSDVQAAVVSCLRQLGRATPEVVEALIGALKGSYGFLWEEMVRSLSQLGQATPEVVPPLAGALEERVIDLLGHGQLVAKAAANILSQLGQATPEVVAVLTGALGARDPDVRRAAASSLGQLGQATPEVVAALVGTLGDKATGFLGDRPVAEAAARSLGQLGQATPEVVAALSRNLHDSDRSVRVAVLEALSKLFDGKPLPGDEWVPLRKRQDG